jgi:pimeloyl-ACP methyl ester carboxylesterase
MQIVTQDFAMSYVERGSGKPLLLIHGFPLSNKIWEPQTEGLAGAARLLAPDLRGHGESEATPGPYSMEMLADDCVLLLDTLGVKQPAVVCGLSMGGYVALAFFRKHRARLAGLILAATRAGADSPEGKTNREKSAARVREEGIQAVIGSMLPKMLAPKTYDTNPALVERVERIMEETSEEGMIAALLGMRDRPDSNPLLDRIDIPTLILHGADDQLIPVAEAEAMRSAIRDSKLEVLPVAGHLLNMEQPALFNQTVRDFLASIG